MVACWSGQGQYDALVLACGVLVLALELRKYQQKQLLNIVKIQAPPISSSSITSQPQWLLTDESGEEHHGQLHLSTRATSWLVYLSFHINYGVTKKKYQTAIWRGDITASQWRELVTYLRFTAIISEH